jgi:hypothetical protein
MSTPPTSTAAALLARLLEKSRQIEKNRQKQGFAPRLDPDAEYAHIFCGFDGLDLKKPHVFTGPLSPNEPVSESRRRIRRRCPRHHPKGRCRVIRRANYRKPTTLYGRDCCAKAGTFGEKRKPNKTRSIVQNEIRILTSGSTFEKKVVVPLQKTFANACAVTGFHPPANSPLVVHHRERPWVPSSQTNSVVLRDAPPFCYQEGINKGLGYPRRYLEPRLCIPLLKERHVAYYAWQRAGGHPRSLASFAQWLQRPPSKNSNHLLLETWIECAQQYKAEKFPPMPPSSWDVFLAQRQARRDEAYADFDQRSQRGTKVADCAADGHIGYRRPSEHKKERRRRIEPHRYPTLNSYWWPSSLLFLKKGRFVFLTKKPFFKNKNQQSFSSNRNNL